MWVLLHHSFEHHPVQGGITGVWESLVVGVSTIGWLGVSLFLVLSGFCLYYPLVCHAPISEVRLSLREFFWRRAGRILPPYYAAFLLFTFMGGFYAYLSKHTNSLPELAFYHDPAQFCWHIASHLLLVHNLFPHTFSSINGAFWSLALEAQLYLLFPLFVWVAARHGLRTLLLSTLAVSLIWQGFIFHRLGFSLYSFPLMSTAYHALPGRCFEFAAGMTAAAIVARPAGQNSRLLKTTAAVLLVPALLYVTALSRYGPFCDQVWGLIFAGLIVCVASVREAVWANIILRGLHRLGLISYSVYLIHMPLIAEFQFRLLGASDRSRPFAYFVGVAVILLVILVGNAFYCIVEKPAINYIARIVAARRLKKQAAGIMTPIPAPVV